MITAGIDIGSITAKAAVMRDGNLLGTKVISTGYNAEKAGRKVLDELLAQIGMPASAVERIVSTGYGRNSVDFADRVLTEIVCHGAGVRFLNPRIRLVIDVGGQDSKAIALDPEGRVEDFAMNDKCAAGTGRFLANAAEVMGLSLDQVGPLSLEGKHPVKITTVCTVFVESDILSYLAQGKKPPDILSGVHLAIARRTVSLARRVPIEPAITLTGGVARNVGMVHALEEILATKLQVSPDAHFTGAIGAALFALDKMGQSFENSLWSPSHAHDRGN
jgi:predicted CoA-substrate-specific enzyme activase